MFATSIDNGENLRVFVGNNKIFSDNILNYSTNAYRALSFKVQLSFATDPLKAIEIFSAQLKALPKLPFCSRIWPSWAAEIFPRQSGLFTYSAIKDQ